MQNSLIAIRENKIEEIAVDVQGKEFQNKVNLKGKTSFKCGNKLHTLWKPIRLQE